MAYVKIRPRRSTAVEWEYDNPVLAEGELAIEVPVTGVGTGFVNIKFGDGVTHWKDIPYALMGNPDGESGEFSNLESRLSAIETFITDITPRLAVSSPNVTILTLNGEVVDEVMLASTSDTKILDVRTKALEDEIASLQTVMLLLDDVS